MNYFKLLMAGPRRHLSLEKAGITEIESWVFLENRPIDPVYVPSLRVIADGPVVDYNLTAFGVEVVSEKIKNAIERFSRDAVQFLRAELAGEQGPWYAMNVLPLIDCLDVSRSKVIFHPETHCEKPGQPNIITWLIIDQQKATPCPIFKIKGWSIPTIISEELRRELELSQVTGLEYYPVT